MSHPTRTWSPGTCNAVLAGIVILAANAAAKTGVEVDPGSVSVVQFAVSETTLREGDTAEPTILKVVVHPPSARRLQIPVRLSGTAAASDVVFQSSLWRPDPADPAAAVLTIPARADSVAVPLVAVDDRVEEPVESLLLQISGEGPGWKVGEPSIQNARILEPYKVPLIAFIGASSEVSVKEGEELRLRVGSTSPLEKDVKFSIEFSGDVAADDWKIDPPVIALGPAAQSADVRVSAAPDRIFEGDEKAVLRLPADFREPKTYALGELHSLSASIVDVDVAPTFTLSAPRTATVDQPLTARVEASVRSAKSRDISIAVSISVSTSDGKPIPGLDSQATATIPAGEVEGLFRVNVAAATWPSGEHKLRLKLPAELAVKGPADGVAEVLVQNLNYSVGLFATATDMKEASPEGVEFRLQLAADVVAAQDLPVTIVATSPAVPSCAPKRNYRLKLGSSDLPLVAAVDLGGWKTDLVIPKGEKSVSVTLCPVDDLTDEPNKKLTLSVAGKFDPEHKSAEFTLTDDDSEPLVKIVSEATKIVEGAPQPTEFTLQFVGSRLTEHAVKGRITVSGAPNVVVEPNTFTWTTQDADGKDVPPPVFRLTAKDDDLLTTTIDEPERTFTVALEGLQNAEAAPGGEWRPALVDDELVRGDVLLLVACTDELLRLSADGEEPLRDVLDQLSKEITQPVVESRLVARAPLMLTAGKPALRAIDVAKWKLPGEDEAFDKFDVDAILNAALAAEARVAELRAGRPPLRVILLYPHNHRSGRSKFGTNKLVGAGAAPAKRRVILFPVEPNRMSLDATSDLGKQLVDYCGNNTRVGLFDSAGSDSLSRLLGSFVTRAIGEF